MSQHLSLWLPSSLAQTWIKSMVPLSVSAPWKTILVYSSCKAIAHISTKHPSLTHQHKNRHKGPCTKQFRLGVGWGGGLLLQLRRKETKYCSPNYWLNSTSDIYLPGYFRLWKKRKLSTLRDCYFCFYFPQMSYFGLEYLHKLGGKKKNYSEDPRRHM